MKHGMRIGDAEFDIGLSRAAEGYRLHLEDRSFPAKLLPGEDGGWVLHSPAGIAHIEAAVDGDDVWIHLDGRAHCLRFEHALERLAQLADAAGGDAIRATMPGSLISLEVAAGESVTKGQTLLVMESMKMETTILAPRDGTVAEIMVAPGQTFNKDAVLLSLEPEQ